MMRVMMMTTMVVKGITKRCFICKRSGVKVKTYPYAKSIWSRRLQLISVCRSCDETVE